MRLADHAVYVGLRRTQGLLQTDQAAAMQLQQLGMHERLSRWGQAQREPRPLMQQRGQRSAIGARDG